MPARINASLIISRYKKYYSAWNDKSPSEQLILASVIAKNILNKDEDVMDARVTFAISTDLLLTLKYLKDLAKEMS